MSFSATSTDKENIIADQPTQVVFSAVVMNKGVDITAQESSIFDFELYLSPNQDLTDAAQLTGATFEGLDTPPRTGPFHKGQTLSYVGIRADVDPSKEDVMGNYSIIFIPTCTSNIEFISILVG